MPFADTYTHIFLKILLFCQGFVTIQILLGVEYKYFSLNNPPKNTIPHFLVLIQY